MPRIVDSEIEEQRFIEASLSIIAAGGLAALSLRKVAMVAGCTTGALTHYFRDKDTLLLATLQSVHNAAAHRMMKKIAANENDAERLMKVLLEALPLDEERVAEWRVWLAFWAASTANPELEIENAKRYAQWQIAVQSLLKPFTNDYKDEGDVLIALIDGLALNVIRQSHASNDLKRRQKRCRILLQRHLAAFVSPEV